MSTNAGDPAPLYARVLRLRHLRPGGVVCFILFEMMIAVAVLLALAELVNWWAVPVLPVAVAVMVKVNDVLMGLNRVASGEVDRRAPVDPDGGHGGYGPVGAYDPTLGRAGRVPGGRSPVDQSDSRTGNARAFELARRDGARRNDGRARSGRASVPGMRSGPARGEVHPAGRTTGNARVDGGRAGTPESRAANGTTYHSRSYREPAPRRRIREARRPIGVIKLSLPPRDGGVLPKASGATTPAIEASRDGNVGQPYAGGSRAAHRSDVNEGRFT